MFATAMPYLSTNLESRSISPGNPTGERGGVPVDQTNHCIGIPAGETTVLADIKGPGMLRSFWLTVGDRSPEALRSYIIRIYWDDSEHASVEAPLGDFFGLAHGRAAHYYTPYMGVSEGKGFNCFFPMPFAKRCRLMLENNSTSEAQGVFYQVNYTLGDDITPEMTYFHSHFRRTKPPAGEPFTILDTQGSAGVFVGMNTSALPCSKGTWREGDFRFYLNGDKHATIVGTGWSDWFQSAWGLGIHQSAYAGSSYQVLHPEYEDKAFCSSYRFHVLDPIYFQSGLKVEHDPRGFSGFWEKEPRQDDWCSTAYWYQHLTVIPLPQLPSRQERIADIEIQPWEKNFAANELTADQGPTT